MPIEEIRIDDETKSYQYVKPAREILWRRFSSLMDRLESWVSLLPDLNFEKNISVNGRAWGEMIIRVDKRSDYFLIFHEQTHISEIKKVALYVYWILKFRPICVINVNVETASKYSCINETFAMYILYSVLREEASRKKTIFAPSAEYTRRLAYAFKFWDISKEAFILIAETLAESMLNKTVSK